MSVSAETKPSFVYSAVDLGGQREPNFSLTETILQASAFDRILSPVAPQETVFPSTGSIDFHSDFEQVDILHFKLGMRTGQRLAHDPAMERARYERATSDGERQAIKQGVVINMEKTLYERAFTSHSTVMYHQDDAGRIYHPHFPGEAFDVVLQRGLEYSKRNGFVDWEREAAEFAGWKEAMTILFDPETPLESKVISISGSGQKKGTAFTDNFVDIFTKTINPVTNKVVVAMTRFASDMGYEEYKKIAAKLDNNYFGLEKIKTNEELEIYLKRHPIFLNSTIDSRDATQIFNQEFKKQKRATEEEKTKQYLNECRLCILDYAETICAKFFDPESIKLSFNTVINKFDHLRKGLVKTISRVAAGISEYGRKAVSFLNTVQEDKNYYGRMRVEEIMQGCGPLGGFSIGGAIKSIEGIISGAINRIAGLFKDKDHCINCGACGVRIDCVVRKGGSCPKCKAVRRC